MQAAEGEREEGTVVVKTAHRMDGGAEIEVDTRGTEIEVEVKPVSMANNNMMNVM